MYKKIAVVMSISILLTSAHAQELSVKSALKQFQFSLDVEWDQKDLKIRNQIIRTFKNQLFALNAKGQTTQDILNEIKSELNNKQLIQDMDNLLSIATKEKMNSQHIQKLALDFAKLAKKSGASWDDDATSSFVSFFSVIFIVAILILTQEK